MQYTKLQNVMLVAMRIVLAGIFIYAGYGKWFFWSAAPAGMPAAFVVLMKFLSIAEPLGAVALLAGFLTRSAAWCLAIIMFGSLFVVRLMMHTSLFTSQQGTGMDYNFTILAGCLILAAFGAGNWAIDAMRKKA